MWADNEEILSGETPQRVLDRVERQRNNERSEILNIAQTFVKREDRSDVPTVMTVAIPLLEWLDEANSKNDREARMEALKRVHLAAITNSVRETTPASQVIAQASVYYQFIIAE